MPTSLKIICALVLSFGGAFACGVFAISYSSPLHLLALVVGLAVFIAGITIVHRVTADETARQNRDTIFALREEVARLQPVDPVLPLKLLETGDHLRRALEQIGTSASTALQLMMMIRAETVGVDRHVALLEEHNDALRADNELLDHISGTVAARGPAPKMPGLTVHPFPPHQSREFSDRRRADAFAPPAVREAQAKAAGVDPAVAEAVTEREGRWAETAGLRAIVKAIAPLEDRERVEETGS